MVNPVAGMGGSVGLKGTDGPDTVDRARSLGAVPVAADRALRALTISGLDRIAIEWIVAPGEMGADVLGRAGLDGECLAITDRPSAEATRAAVRQMIDRGADVVVFAGGDGTARDVARVTGLDVPVLGIPCGVKMHSGVFATTPEAAGRLLAELGRGGAGRIGYHRVEIMDIDEDALRAGRLNARLYGYVRAPRLRNLMQNAKATPPLADEAMLEALGHEVASEMAAGVTYLIGPGTTAKRPMKALGLASALLGVDVVRDGRLVASDVAGDAALAAAGEGPLAIVTGVTGGQGFVFGRGNQQIGPEAIRRCWPGDVTILASAEKLARLPRPELIVDTGDPSLDAEMRGYARVRTGPRRSVMMRLV